MVECKNWIKKSLVEWCLLNKKNNSRVPYSHYCEHMFNNLFSLFLIFYKMILRKMFSFIYDYVRYFMLYSFRLRFGAVLIGPSLYIWMELSATNWSWRNWTQTVLKINSWGTSMGSPPYIPSVKWKIYNIETDKTWPSF